MPSSTDQQLGNLLKRLRTAASAYNQEHPELPLSIATGYAIATPEITSLEDAFRQADNHMYNDKSQHRESARRLILNSFLRKVQGREGTQQKDIQHMQMLITKLAQKLQHSGYFNSAAASSRTLLRHRPLERQREHPLLQSFP